MQIDLEPFTADGDADRLERVYGLYDRCVAVDDPLGPAVGLPLRRLAGLGGPIRALAHGTGSIAGWWSVNLCCYRQHAWLAMAGGADVGACLVQLPEWDQTDVAFVTVVVAPEHRRRGIGTELLRHAGTWASETGRTTLIGYAARHSSGEFFAEAAGARSTGSTDVRSVQPILARPDAEESLLRRAAEQASAAWSLVSWWDPVADEHAAGVAALLGAMADAPRPDSMAEESWDVPQLRAREAGLRAAGLSTLNVAAKRRGTGDLDALTTVIIDSAFPDLALQNVTVVARDQRGHRLGTRVKLAALELIRRTRPELRRMATSNEARNRYMLDVNRRLGYRPSGEFTAWEIGL